MWNLSLDVGFPLFKVATEIQCTNQVWSHRQIPNTYSLRIRVSFSLATCSHKPLNYYTWFYSHSIPYFLTWPLAPNSGFMVWMTWGDAYLAGRHRQSRIWYLVSGWWDVCCFSGSHPAPVRVQSSSRAIWGQRGHMLAFCTGPGKSFKVFVDVAWQWLELESYSYAFLCGWIQWQMWN